jgi:hypothetical protein
MFYKTLHRRLRIEQYEPHNKNGGELNDVRKVTISCFNGDTRRVILVTNPVTSHESRDCDNYRGRL